MRAAGEARRGRDRGGTESLRVATYNIHCGIGGDRRYDPDRVARVLAELGADLIALQEVHTGAGGRRLLHDLAAHIGAEPISGATLMRGDAEYGNALLSRHRVVGVERVDLSVPPHEPRGALDVVIDAVGTRVRVVATHLGLWPYERRRQIRWLLGRLDREAAYPTVLAGDLNEWFLWGRPLRWLHRRFMRTPAPATFPARCPVFALDRLWVDPPSMLTRLAAHSSPLARLASDHLPLVATLDLRACRGTPRVAPVPR